MTNNCIAQTRGSAPSHLLCFSEEVVEVDHYTSFYPTYTKDVSAYKKNVEEIQVLGFLAGLSLEYEQIRAQILNMNLSSLN